jgi:two-component system, chemotaxis family, chemotaxis protein CheY
MACVLIVEDDPLLRELLCTVLEEAGYETLEAADGETGIELFRAQQPEIVLLDILLPLQDGIETLRALRKEYPRAKIVAMSGGGQGVTKENALAAATALGAVQTLAKPFSREQLLGIVTAVLAPEE